jgi:hypothetical protein
MRCHQNSVSLNLNVIYVHQKHGQTLEEHQITTRHDYDYDYAIKTMVVGGKWFASRPCRFTPGGRALGTHWMGG